MNPMKPMQPMKPMAPLSRTEPWWPLEWGEPSASGSQEGTRYAFFRRERRLLIERDGKLQTYDSGDHDIQGVAQVDGKAGSPVFTSPQGPVRIGDLKLV